MTNYNPTQSHYIPNGVILPFAPFPWFNRPTQEVVAATGAEPHHGSQHVDHISRAATIRGGDTSGS